MPKARGISLHIGVNAVDPKHYAGWKGELKSCEHDAEDMAAVAKSRGMKAKVLLTKSATRDSVLKAVQAACSELRKGDLFLLTYSGHGGQIVDVSGDEMDQKDETWCLHDAQIIDDEIQREICLFATGVRVVALSDASPSGSVTRPYLPEPDPPPAGLLPRLMPPLVGEKVYKQNEKFYDAIAKSLAAKRPPKGGPLIVAIHGCQHNQAAIDAKDNGAFTARLLDVWNSGSYRGNYLRFHAAITSRMPSTQTPLMRTRGDVAQFLLQQPFSL